MAFKQNKVLKLNVEFRSKLTNQTVLFSLEKHGVILSFSVIRCSIQREKQVNFIMSGENTFKISVMNSSVHTYSCPLIGVVFWSVGRVKRKSPVESSASCHIDERWGWQRDTDRTQIFLGFFWQLRLTLIAVNTVLTHCPAKCHKKSFFFCINTLVLLSK